MSIHAKDGKAKTWNEADVSEKVNQSQLYTIHNVTVNLEMKMRREKKINICNVRTLGVGWS